MSKCRKEITLLDAAFAVTGDPIKVFESLLYTDAWEKHGSIALVVGVDCIADLRAAAWVQVDGRVYEIETLLSEDDALTVKVTGASLNVLLDRVVATADERLQGRLEERVRYLVNEYAITGGQAVAQLELGTDHAYARAMDINVKRGDRLSDVLYTALNQRGFSYEITLADDGALVFDVLCALDRSQDQSVNEPVSMSTLGAIEKASYKRSNYDYRNYAIVCDEDADNPKTVEVDLSHGTQVRSMYVSGSRAGADESAAPNCFVMVGAYSAGVGYIATSQDGQTWTARVTSGVSQLWSIAYQNGRFIAGGDTGDLMISSDAINWTKIESGSSYSLEGVDYIDGLYLTYTNAGAIATSYDAISWNPVVTGLSGKTVNSVQTPLGLVAYTSGLSSIKKSVSRDVLTWKTTSIPIPGSPAQSFLLRTIYENGIVVSAGFIYTGSVYKPFTVTSPDGGATETICIIESMSGKKFGDMAFGLGLFVAVGDRSNTIAWSTDGISFVDCTPAGAGTPDWVAVCFDGTTFHAYSATTKHRAYSTDGKVWTLTTFSTSAALVDAVVYGTSSHSGELYQIGIDALTEAAVVETLDGDVNSDLAPIYKTDYNVGDVLDVVDPVRSIVAAKRVLSVEHLIDRNTDLSITPKFGKDFLTLRQLIQKELKK